jgi:translation initiation factor 3 subunit J
MHRRQVAYSHLLDCIARLVEQADLAAAKELFGEMGGLNLDSFLPKSLKDFEDYAAKLASKYVLCHKDSKHYKVRGRKR